MEEYGRRGSEFIVTLDVDGMRPSTSSSDLMSMPRGMVSRVGRGLRVRIIDVQGATVPQRETKGEGASMVLIGADISAVVLYRRQFFM